MSKWKLGLCVFCFLMSLGKNLTDLMATRQAPNAPMGVGIGIGSEISTGGKISGFDGLWLMGFDFGV